MQLIDISVKFREMSRKIGKIPIYWRNIVDNYKKKNPKFLLIDYRRDISCRYPLTHDISEKYRPIFSIFLTLRSTDQMCLFIRYSVLGIHTIIGITELITLFLNTLENNDKKKLYVYMYGPFHSLIRILINQMDDC